MKKWRRVYSLSSNGASLDTLYRRVRDAACQWSRLKGNGIDVPDTFPATRPAIAETPCPSAQLLVLRDVNGVTFGGYLSHALIQPSTSARVGLGAGNNESFVFTTRNRNAAVDGDGEMWKDEHVPCTNSADEDTNVPITTFKANQVQVASPASYVTCRSDILAIGGSDGTQFAFSVDSDLCRGTSGPCSTFHSGVLSENAKFDCMAMEVWMAM